jgi:hypothetical protein
MEARPESEPGGGKGVFMLTGPSSPISLLLPPPNRCCSTAPYGLNSSAHLGPHIYLLSASFRQDTLRYDWVSKARRSFPKVVRWIEPDKFGVSAVVGLLLEVWKAMVVVRRDVCGGGEEGDSVFA